MNFGQVSLHIIRLIKFIIFIDMFHQTLKYIETQFIHNYKIKLGLSSISFMKWFLSKLSIQIFRFLRLFNVFQVIK